MVAIRLQGLLTAYQLLCLKQAGAESRIGMFEPVEF